MRFHSILLGSVLLASSCAVPGGSAWSDLHAYGFGSIYAAGLEASSDDITVDDSSGGGFDFQGGLDLKRSTETVAYYGARLGFAPLELSVSRFGYDGSSEGTVTGGISFAGMPIAGDLAVTSDVELSVSKLMLGFDIVNLPVARVGLLAGLDYVEFARFDLIATENKPGVSIGDVQTLLEDQSAPVPIVGLRADAALPFGVRLGGEITGIKFDFDDADLSYLDYDIAARYEPWDHVELMIGYRAIIMQLDGAVDGTQLNMDFNLDGPYAGVAVYF